MPYDVLQMAGVLGMQDVNADMMSTKLDDMMATIRQVNEQFKNAVSPATIRQVNEQFNASFTWKI
jgi:hypothetical protein